MQALPSHGEPVIHGDPHYDISKEKMEFEETKAGVKGLIDAGTAKVPRLFIQPSQNLTDMSSDTETATTGLQIPIIDMMGYQESRRQDVVNGLRVASETWGFFQIINHGVPVDVIQGMLEAVKQFHEQPEGTKREWYLRDDTKGFRYYSSGELFRSKSGTWKDSILFNLSTGVLEPEAVPLICREPLFEYNRQVEKLKMDLCELLSEALGLDSNYLADNGCMEFKRIVGHYYPSCPEPELTMGTISHSDATFLTLLLQNNHGGLQVLHQNQWVDVSPIPGAILANIGDFMQLITNDKFKSVKHRVVSRCAGPRVSVACFLFPGGSRTFGPIKELLGENMPPMYRETSLKEYYGHYLSKSHYGEDILPLFRVGESEKRVQIP